MNPRAIYNVYEIYNPTNNAVSIKIETKIPYNLETHIRKMCLSSHTSYILPICGDTPFCAFGNEIKDFYLTRKKTGRRYLRRLRIYT